MTVCAKKNHFQTLTVKTVIMNFRGINDTSNFVVQDNSARYSNSVGVINLSHIFCAGGVE